MPSENQSCMESNYGNAEWRGMMKRDFKEVLKKAPIYLLIFLLFLIGSMFTIRNNLDNQVEYSVEEIINLKKDQVYDLTFANMKMQTLYIDYQADGSVHFRNETHGLHYVLPLVFSFIGVMIFALVVGFTKKYTSKKTL